MQKEHHFTDVNDITITFSHERLIAINLSTGIRHCQQLFVTVLNVKVDIHKQITVKLY